MRITSLLAGWTALVTASCNLAQAQDGVTRTPLSPPSKGNGTTLFTTLSPQETGLIATNDFSDPRLWDSLYQEWVYGGIGSGVAVADYDGDGRPDIFVVSKCERSRLFRNLGDWKFQDVSDQAGITDLQDKAWQQGAVFADVNGDGKPDLYVCRFGAPNLLWINQGDGTFREEAAARGLALIDASGMAAFGDYDRDGDLDVYVVTNMLDATRSPDGQPDHLFRNDGRGVFTEVGASAGITGISLGHSALWWDYDNDGWPDLYVSNDYKTPDRLYRNNGDGTFSDVIAKTVPVMPYYSMGADVGDVNNDGHLDFLAADMAASTREKDQRGFANSRARAQLPPESPGDPYQVMRNVLYLGTGTGYFREAAQLAGLAATDWTWSVRWEDLDNDGLVDLHVTNGMVREYHNADLSQKIIGMEASGASRQIMKASPVMAETDFAYRNRGDLQFESVGPKWGLDHDGVSFGAAFADFDGDGDLDLVRTHYQEGPSLLRNDCPSGHRLTLSLRGKGANRFGIGSRVELITEKSHQTRSLITTRGYFSCSDALVHFGLGEETRVRELRIRWPDGNLQVLTDIAADQHLEITEPDAIKPQSHEAPEKALFEAPALPRATKDKAPKEALAQAFLPWDLNRTGPTLSVLPGKSTWLSGSSGAQARQLWSAEAGPQKLGLPTAANEGPLLQFDANGDGYNDLLQCFSGTARPAGSDSYRARLWLGDSSGELIAAPADALPNLALSVGAACLADWDRDGDLDVFVGSRLLPGRYPQSGRSVLLRNDGGTFVDVTATLAPPLAEGGLVTAAQWSDLDGDGWVDLIVVNEWGNVTAWMNKQGQNFQDATERLGLGETGPGWWSSLAIADCNEDGRPDLVVGNAGLNTGYPLPSALYYGDFKGGGAPPFMIEASGENGVYFPRRTKSELAAKLPALTKRFASTDEFARTTLRDLVGQDRLGAARSVSVLELRSGVFLSQPDGRFKFRPLPRLAQIAPAQALLATDFDGDGHTDLFILQNSHAPAASTGPFTGGLSQLLLGNGQGDFAIVDPIRSGLILPGEGKAAALLDANNDGAPDLVTMDGQGAAHLFINRAKGPFLRLDLNAKGGNAHALGARITFEFSDGTTRVAEVSSGSGSSQGTASCFTGYTAANRVIAARVRWPSGQETRHQAPAAGSGWSVSE